MASELHNSGKLKILSGNVDLTSDTIQVILLTSSHTPNIDAAQTFISDISANEVSTSGTGYSRKTLASKTFTQDDTNNRAVFDAADVSWPASTIPDARYAYIVKSTGTDATSPILGHVDLGSTQTSSGSTFTLQWDADGIFYLA